jgi:IS5 family transposase
MQFVVEVKSKRVLSVAIGKGRVHDLKLLKNSRTRCAQEVKMGGDKGYQGIKKWHSNSQTPHKKPRGGELSKEQKRENRLLASERIVVEHVNRRFKRPCP